MVELAKELTMKIEIKERFTAACKQIKTPICQA